MVPMLPMSKEDSKAMAPLALVSQENQCPRCSAELPPNAKTCPSCLHDIDGDKDVYEIAADADLADATWLEGAAVYALEQAAKCPQCRESIDNLRVLGLTRTQVAFTSTLPRKGRVIVCPKCGQIISAELSGTF